MAPPRANLLWRGLRARGLFRHFGALLAVDDFSIELKPGDIVGLIGANGAGKTTALNLLNGIVPANKGQVFIDGADVTNASAADRADMGLARSFQQPRLVADLTCVENVVLGAQGRFGNSLRQEGRLFRRAKEAMDRIGVREAVRLNYPDQTPPADRRWIEIARILAADPSIIFLDEPTSGFTAAEVKHLASRIRALSADGIAVLLVTHDVSLAMSVCERIVVMSVGRVIANGTPREVLAEDEVVSSYLGEKGRALATKALLSAAKEQVDAAR